MLISHSFTHIYLGYQHRQYRDVDIRYQLLYFKHYTKTVQTMYEAHTLCN